MKKKIAILSLIAIFVSASALTAQTTTTKTEKAKTEQKACCKGKAQGKCCKDKKVCVKKAVKEMK